MTVTGTFLLVLMPDSASSLVRYKAIGLQPWDLLGGMSRLAPDFSPAGAGA
jgi:hypothetical protein